MKAPNIILDKEGIKSVLIVITLLNLEPQFVSAQGLSKKARAVGRSLFTVRRENLLPVDRC